MQVSRLLAFCVIIGVLLIVLGLVVVPWLDFSPAIEIDERTTNFQQNSFIQEILDRVPTLKETLGISPSFAPGQIDPIFSDPQKQQVVSFARHHPSLTGWMLWRDIDLLSKGLSWSIGLTIACAILGLLVVPFVMLIKSVFLGKSFLLVSMFGAFLSLMLMLAYLPHIDTFGDVGDLSLAFLGFLLGAETRAGVYVVMAGLLFLALGLVFMILTFAPRQDDNNRDDEFMA